MNIKDKVGEVQWRRGNSSIPDSWQHLSVFTCIMRHPREQILHHRHWQGVISVLLLASHHHSVGSRVLASAATTSKVCLAKLGCDVFVCLCWNQYYFQCLALSLSSTFTKSICNVATLLTGDGRHIGSTVIARNILY